MRKHPVFDKFGIVNVVGECDKFEEDIDRFVDDESWNEFMPTVVNLFPKSIDIYMQNTI